MHQMITAFGQQPVKAVLPRSSIRGGPVVLGCHCITSLAAPTDG